LALSADGTTLAAGAESNVVFLSTNFGMNWATNIIDSQYAGQWDAVACSADATRIFAASADGIFMSVDAGRNWVRIHDPDNFQSIAVSADGTQLVAAAMPSIIYRSNNTGASWIRSDLGQTNASSTTVAITADGSQIYAGAKHYGDYYPLQTLQTTPEAPVLTLVPGSTNLTVLWTYPAKNYVLQTSTDPTTNFWVDVPDAPILNPAKVQNQVNLRTPTQPTFFRLVLVQSVPSTFQDLDFESATVILSTNQFQAGSLELAPAFPGWVAYIGTNQVDLGSLNGAPLDGATITLQSDLSYIKPDPSWHGYWAAIFAGGAYQLGRLSASLGQTGVIPAAAHSVIFKAWFVEPPAPVITVNGQALTMTPIGGNLFAVNVAKFAGTTAELRFTVLPVPPQQGANPLYLDSIYFSTRPFP
jgi:hypothetical protein